MPTQDLQANVSTISSIQPDCIEASRHSMFTSPKSEFSSISASDLESESFADVLDAADSTPSQPPPEPTEKKEIGSAEGETRRNKDYYFDDGSVEFLLGSEIYRVHRYLFSRDSTHFAGQFDSASSSVIPIELPDTTPIEFDAFLDVLYSSCYRQPRIASVEEWTSVLRLATKWSFDAIRALAIGRLELIASPVDKISISHTFGITHWLQGAYTALCMRLATLSADEIRALQAEDVALIMKVREDVLCHSDLSRTLAHASDVSSRVAELLPSPSADQVEASPSETASVGTDRLEPPKDDSILPTLPLSPLAYLLNELEAGDFNTISDKIITYAYDAGSDPDASAFDEIGTAVWKRAVSHQEHSSLYARLLQKLVKQLDAAPQATSTFPWSSDASPGSKRPADRLSEVLRTSLRLTITRRAHGDVVAPMDSEKQCGGKRGAAVGRFAAELYKWDVLTMHDMHEHINALLDESDQAAAPYEDGIEQLHALLSSAGILLDRFNRGKRCMEAWIARMTEMKRNNLTTPRTETMLEEIISLHEKGWLFTRVRHKLDLGGLWKDSGIESRVSLNWA